MLQHAATRLRPLVLIALLVPAASAQVGSKIIASPDGTAKLIYKLNSTTGIQLESLGDSSSQPFTFRTADLWEVTLRKHGSFNPADNVSVTASTGPRTFTHSKTPTNVTATWVTTAPVPSPAAGTLTVVVTGTAVNKPNTIDPGHVEFDIAVDYNGTGYSILSVDFPRIPLNEREGGSGHDQILAVPRRGCGWLLTDPMHSTQTANLIHTVGYSGPQIGLSTPGGYTMQFFSYYNKSEGPDAWNLVLSTRDPAGDVKQFYMQHFAAPAAGPEAILFELQRTSEDILQDTSFDRPYPFVLTAIKGDWYDACRYYRRWAEGAPWTEAGPIRTNPVFPAFLKSAQMMFPTQTPGCCEESSYLGNGNTQPCPPDGGCVGGLRSDDEAFAEWQPQLLEQQSFFGVDRMTSIVYTWDKDSFPGFSWGQWTPEKPGFLSALPAINGVTNHNWIYYFNVGPYSDNVPGFPSTPVIVPGSDPAQFYNVLDHVIIDQNGSPLIRSQQERQPQPPTCSDQSACEPLRTTYGIDPRTPFQRDYLLHYVDRMQSLGADGVYLDAYTLDDPDVTYSTTPSPYSKHGGSGATQARRDQLTEVRSAKPGFAIISEGMQEVYVGLVDQTYCSASTMNQLNRFEGDTPRMMIAPLYQTVYHDYQLTTAWQQIAAPPTGLFLDLDPDAVDAWRDIRRAYAVELFFGHMLRGGSTLSAGSLGALRASGIGNSDRYIEYTDMVKNCAQILRHDSARAFSTLGERMRDPGTSCAGMIERRNVFVPYGDQTSGGQAGFQPYVYTSAFVREDIYARPTLAVLLVNWSAAQDAVLRPDLYPGAGTQAVSVTLDPAEYGMTGNYKRREILSTGLAPGGISNFPLATPFTETVPELSARMFVFVPE